MASGRVPPLHGQRGTPSQITRGKRRIYQTLVLHWLIRPTRPQPIRLSTTQTVILELGYHAYVVSRFLSAPLPKLQGLAGRQTTLARSARRLLESMVRSSAFNLTMQAH